VRNPKRVFIIIRKRHLNTERDLRDVREILLVGVVIYLRFKRVLLNIALADKLTINEIFLQRLEFLFSQLFSIGTSQ